MHNQLRNADHETVDEMEIKSSVARPASATPILRGYLRRAGAANFLLMVVAIFLALIVLVAIIGGCAAYSGYHQAVRLDEQVDSSWAQVENVLQRRYDLIPNLVETVKGYASHEKEIFTSIAQSREKYFQADTRGAKMQAAAGIERALSRLLMLRENYPELKAQQSFNNLMAQLEGSENRIAVERKRYNDAVRQLNTYCRGLLSGLWCRWAGVEPAEYFESVEEAAEAPRVDFGTRGEE